MDDTPRAQGLADFLPYQLSIASNAVSNRIADEYRTRFDLKIPEWRVMAVLGDAGASTQRDLTELTLMDKVAVNRACAVLEQRGLVARQPNAEDGRSHLLVLTGDGREMFQAIMPLAREMERQLFASLSAGEQAQFRSLLEKIRAGLDAIGPGTA